LDFSNIAFNNKHGTEAAAKDAIAGLRQLLAGFMASVLAIVLLAYADHHYWQTAESLPVLVHAGWALMLLGIGFSMYGSYLTASALGWAGFITGTIVVSTFVPYAKFLVILFLMVKAYDLVEKAGFQFTLLGPPKRRAARD
jgi:hypothetical protein